MLRLKHQKNLWVELPAKTICPFLLKILANGMMASGSVACPASSRNKCVKWFSGNPVKIIENLHGVNKRMAPLKSSCKKTGC